jgi:methyltransferase
MSEIFGLDTRQAYLVLLGLIIVERVGELIVSRRNLRRALARGGIEAGDGHYPWMVALHTAFLIACPAEVYLLGRPFRPALAAAALAVVCLAMALRYWAVAALGPRWTTRVIVLPGEAPVTTGPYRFLRHPNYLAVVLEILALPLVHGAWATALLFSALNGLLLRTRIRTEEEALERHSAYSASFLDKPRLIPR